MVTIIDKLAIRLEEYEICCSVYIAGYLIKVTPELSLEGDLVASCDANFVLQVSRGGLNCPSVYLTVQLYIIFAKSVTLTCHEQLTNVIDDISYFYDIDPPLTRSVCKRLANVILSGHHKRSSDELSSPYTVHVRL